MITVKIDVCGVAKLFLWKVSLRDKQRALNRAVLKHPDQFASKTLTLQFSPSPQCDQCQTLHDCTTH